jgi:biotin carboxyl carrier protein
VPAFDVTVGGKTYRVEIPDPAATPLQVIVDGEPFEVEIVDAEAVAAAKLAPPPPPAPEPSPLAHPTPIQVAQPAAPADSGGGSDVIAPLPGTILSVEVSVGQQVEAGQVLCVLEAMKMKNPIRAAHPGRVVELRVQPGQTVPHGDVLVRLA